MTTKPGLPHRPLAELPQAVGEQLGPTDWVQLDADQLRKFGEATYLKDRFEADWQISQNNELGGDLIDGFLLLSVLLPFHMALWPYRDEGTWALNYGFDRVRFAEPVYVGDRIRMTTEVEDVREHGTGGYRVVTSNLVEVAEREKPAVIADWVMLYLPSGAEVSA